MTGHVLYVGGADNNLRIPFILAMKGRGWRVTAAGSGSPEPFIDAGIDYVPFHFERFLTPLADWRAMRSLLSMLRELNPDIAQGYDAKPCLFLPIAAQIAGVETRTVRTICGRAWVYSLRSPLALAARPIYRGMHRIAARGTAATVFEIESDREFFRRHKMAGRRGIVIPAGGGGVDVAGFERATAASPPPEVLRRELGLGDAEVVITVTRMTRQKGIPALLEAAAMVHAVRPQVRFLLVGPRESEGPFAVPEEMIAAHAPYVVATGGRTDVPALLQLADVFAFPTEYAEGVARVLLEASLARVPIASTSMPGCQEVIEHGVNGLLTPPGNPRMLADAIIELLENRPAAQLMAARAEEQARRRFSLDSIAAHHDRLYHELINERTFPMSPSDDPVSEGEQLPSA